MTYWIIYFVSILFLIIFITIYLCYIYFIWLIYNFYFLYYLEPKRKVGRPSRKSNPTIKLKDTQNRKPAAQKLKLFKKIGLTPVGQKVGEKEKKKPSKRIKSNDESQNGFAGFQMPEIKKEFREENNSESPKPKTGKSIEIKTELLNENSTIGDSIEEQMALLHGNDDSTKEVNKVAKKKNTYMYNDFTYRLERTRPPHRFYYKCFNSYSHNCKARLIVLKNGLDVNNKPVGDHNHDASDFKTSM